MVIYKIKILKASQLTKIVRNYQSNIQVKENSKYTKQSVEPVFALRVFDQLF